MKMDIGRMPHTLALAAWVIGLLLLFRSDSSITAESINVVYLGRSSPSDDPPYQRFLEALNQLPIGLRDKVQTRHVAALSPSSPRYEEAVDEAIALRPKVIVAPSTATAQTLRKRSIDIPVVFTSFSDPVRGGIVTSTVTRPEPFTGVWMADDLDAKRLEVLHDAYPNVKSVAVMVDAIWDSNAQSRARLPEVGRLLGLTVTVLLAENKSDAARWLDDVNSMRFDAWCLPPSGLSTLNSDYIVERLSHWGKPIIIGRSLAAVKGAPLSYGYDPGFRWPAMTDLLSRVLQGEPAGSIPIQRPSRTVLAVRPAAEGFPALARSVIRRADLVIE